MTTLDRIQIDHKKLDEARRALLELANIEDQDEDVSHLTSKLVLAVEISPDQFQRWWTKNNRNLQTVKVIYMNRSIIATEISSAPRSAAVTYVCQLFAIQGNLQNLVLVFSEHDVTDANGQHVSSDALIKVNSGNGVGRAHLSLATAVVEVGVSQGLPDLHDRLGFYANIPSIQIYVVLKKYVAGGMLAIVFTRGVNNIFDASSIWSFGTTTLHHSVMSYLQAQNWMGVCIGPEFLNAPVCSIPNLPEYNVQFPATTLFIGRHGGVPDGALPAYIVDLFEVQSSFLTN